ncbi:MAG: Txe/YoeB family addiction module toxin [Clostridia bacterium]|jgi:toxin YoeB
MVVYKIVYTKDSIKDIEKLKGANLNKKVLALIEIIKNNPFQTPPSYEKLVGDLQGLYSRRINIKHRLVYQILENVQTVKIISMWTHYEKI